MIKPAAG